MKTLSIIVPVYNEEKTIRESLSRVVKQKIPGWAKEIIVVDDGSTDETREQLQKFDTKVQVIFQAANGGKGSAIRRGLQEVKGDIILVQDADLEYNPADYATLLKPFDSSSVNVVYGSRFLGPHLSTMFLYAQGNKFVTLVTNILFNTNITDMETGYKVFRRETLNKIAPLRANRFDIEPEITAKFLKAGYQIYEVPISYYGRKFIEGKKLTWRDGLIALWMLIRCRFFN